MGAIEDIAAERQRQIAVEGWSADHDDTHSGGQLASAAAAYALHTSGVVKSHKGSAPFGWPWDWRWWKPTTPRRDLVKAAALIVAEIERLDRLSEKKA